MLYGIIVLAAVLVSAANAYDREGVVLSSQFFSSFTQIFSLYLCIALAVSAIQAHMLGLSWSEILVQAIPTLSADLPQ